MTKTSDPSSHKEGANMSLVQMPIPTNLTHNSPSSSKPIKTPRPQNVLSPIPTSKGQCTTRIPNSSESSSCFPELTAQDYQGLEDLLTEVDSGRKLDAPGTIFHWKVVDLQPNSPDYNPLVFYILQSCAVTHPNIIRHKDMAYLSNDEQETKLHILIEQPIGPSFGQLKDYYAVHPEKFSAGIFWDCSAQLIFASYVLSKYKDGTFSSCMWCSSRLTAESIFFSNDGCIRLPQYYPLQHSNTSPRSLKHLKGNTSEAIVSLLTDLASVVTQARGADRNTLQITKDELRCIKSFIKRLAAYRLKPYINVHDLKFKNLSEAVILRQQGRHPSYPFPLEMEPNCHISAADKHIHSYVSSCEPPGPGVTSDELFSLSQDSTNPSLPLPSKLGDPSVDDQMFGSGMISRAVLSTETFALFRKQRSVSVLVPVPDATESLDTQSSLPTLSASTCFLYENICQGLLAVKATASKSSVLPPTSKGPKSGAPKEASSKIMLADREIALFGDSFRGVADKPPNTPYGHPLTKTKSVASSIAKRKRPRTLLNPKCIDEIKMYYEGDDLQIPRVNEEEICPCALYLDAITSLNNYDDTDRCINNDKVFTLLLSIDASNQLAELEPRVISFLKRDTVITKIIGCYLLGEIVDESPPFTHRQRRDIYLLFSKLFTHISNDTDLLETILKHQFFKKTFFEMILNADSWLRLTTTKGKEGLSLKDALISKVRKEAFEKFLQEIFSRADAIRFVRTALHGRYNEVMVALIQLQFASPYIRSSICMRLFDTPLIELTLNTLLNFIQSVTTTKDRGSIGKILCISSHLVTCLHTDPTKFRPLTEKMHRLKVYLVELLFSSDNELMALSAYILEFVVSYYSINLCLSAYAHIMASTDAVNNTVAEIIGSMVEFANNVTSTYMKRGPEIFPTDALRIQLILMLILRFVLSTGDATRTAFTWVKNSARASAQDSYSQQSLQAQSLDCHELRRSVTGTSVYTGLELPTEWSGESYASLRNQLKDVLKEVGSIIDTSTTEFLDRVIESERLRNASIIHFLIARIRIALADTVHHFGATPQSIPSICKKLHLHASRSEKHVRKSSESIFLMVIPQKVVMMAMSSEPSLTSRWSSSYYSSDNIVLFSLDADHWAWIEKNNDKIECAARLFGLSAKNVLDALRTDSVNAK